MYAKIFQSIYDGTLGKDWHLRTVFQDFLILADKEGIVDMTTEAISRRTGVPLKIVREAVRRLEEPEEESRNPTCNGRRIERLDNHRAWGWRVVNYKYYRNLCSLEQKRANDVARLAAKREAEKQEKLIKSNTVATCRKSSHDVANVAYTEAEADTYTEENNSSPKPTPKPAFRYPQNFEDTWSVYPRKIEKKAAFKAWKTRIRLGATPKELHSAATHYAEAMQEKSPEWVKHGSTFFGPSEVWKDWIDGNPLEKEQEGWV